MKQYKVLQFHISDRPYHMGDVRELNEIDAKALVKLGVLAEMEDLPASADERLTKDDSPPKNGDNGDNGENGDNGDNGENGDNGKRGKKGQK